MPSDNKERHPNSEDSLGAKNDNPPAPEKVSDKPTTSKKGSTVDLHTLSEAELLDVLDNVLLEKKGKTDDTHLNCHKNKNETEKKKDKETSEATGGAPTAEETYSKSTASEKKDDFQEHKNKGSQDDNASFSDEMQKIKSMSIKELRSMSEQTLKMIFNGIKSQTVKLKSPKNKQLKKKDSPKNPSSRRKSTDQHKTQKPRSKSTTEGESKKEEDYRKTARSTQKGAMDRFIKPRQTSDSQSRKRVSSSPAGDRKKKDPKLNGSPKKK